jgi:lysophospholipase L1-like esterase
MASRVRRAIRLTSLAVLLVTTATLALEVVARLTTARPATPWVPHPFFQVARPRDYAPDRIDSDDPTKRFRYEVDAFGLRGRSLTTLEKPRGTYRIFFVGGSTTENAYTPEELTFPGLVESGLRAKLGANPRVEVGNAGIQGGRSAHTLTQLAVRLPPLAPDLYVVLDGLNDLLDSSRVPYDPTTYELALPLRPRFGDWLFATSRLYALFETGCGALREDDVREAFARRAKDRARKPFAAPARDPGWNAPAFEAALRRAAALASADGVALVLMTQPTLWKPSMSPGEEAVLWVGSQNRLNLEPRLLLAGMRAYNDAVRRVAREPGCLLVDLDAVVPKDLEHFFDDAHLTRKGNAAVAREVQEVLLRDGALPRRVR